MVIEQIVDFVWCQIFFEDVFYCFGIVYQVGVFGEEVFEFVGEFDQFVWWDGVQVLCCVDDDLQFMLGEEFQKFVGDVFVYGQEDGCCFFWWC